jgi:septum formation protein
MNRRKVILASKSKQRINLMKTLGIKFKIKPADIDEKAIKASSAKKRAEKIARAKAEFIFKENPKGIIIAADTFAVLERKMLEKPASKLEAKKMLKFISNKTIIDYTGFCYLDKKNNINYSVTSINYVKFRKLSKNEIGYYVKNNPVTDWAGAFSCAYDAGMALIESNKGSLTTLTHGFPMEELIPNLRKSGVYK